MKKVVSSLMVLVIIGSVCLWWFTRDTLPKKIRIATGLKGGMYHEFGLLLKKQVEMTTKSKVVIINTNGSRDNQRMLEEGKADLAIIQSGSFSMESSSILLPLFYEPVIVVSRALNHLRSIYDLDGMKVHIGPDYSGMKDMAEVIFDFYDIDCQAVSKSFMEDDVENALVTTGLMNESLCKLFRRGDVDVLGMSNPRALELANPHVDFYTIPHGAFCRRPQVPSRDIETVAATALLVGNEDISSVLIETMLESIHESNMVSEYPVLFKQKEVQQWEMYPLHSVSQDFFDPYRKIGILASFMESIAAIKELIFAFLAGVYFFWMRFQEAKKKREKQFVQMMKDRLDVYLEQAVGFDNRYLTTTDPAELEKMIEDLTKIKVKAIKELTNEELRSDNVFLMFLLQCSSIISKIQSKIDRCSRDLHKGSSGQ